MHSGYEIPGIQQGPENTCAPVLLSMNQTHILDQIHTLPATQQLFLDQHHFLPPQTRLTHHHYIGGASAYFPVNFKLGLNEVCKDGGGAAINGGGASLFRGSEQYQVPEDTRHGSLGMLHCWQNQEDSAIKQQPFWEPLPAEVSNENSEIVDRQEHLELNQKEPPATCLDSKRRVHFVGELEAIYKRLDHGNNTNQTGPNEIDHPVQQQQETIGLDHGSDEGEEEASMKNNNAGKQRIKKKKKKKKKESIHNHMINPMMEFLGDLVKKVIDHQENLHQKFAQVIERIDDERRVREEAWRSQELVHFEQEAAARARERALAQSREAMIVCYLEKITGQRINLPPNGTASACTSHDGSDQQAGSLKLKPPGC